MTLPSLIGSDEKEGSSQLQLAAIVEESHDAIIGKTLEGIVTSWNGGATKMFGYSPTEVIGKSMANLFPPELKEELPRLLEKVRRGEVIADYDSVWLREDGSRVDVEFSVSPVHSEGGAIIGASLVGRDITLRKNAEESMRQIALIVENSHDAIIGETLEGIVTSWNGGATRMLGYSAEEMIGKPISLLYPPELQNELPTLFDNLRVGEVIADHDSVRVRKDGSRLDVAFSSSPIKTEDGTVIGVSCVERDISKRMEDERHIKELNDVRNKFISIISHQLRTPLTAVNWNLETILNGDFGKLEEVTRKFLQVTYKESVEITHRIHDLLTAMDIEEGRVVFQTEEASLDSIVAAIMSEMMKKAELKNVSCTYIAPEKELPVAIVDIEKIRLAITKLVENSIIYTKNGGTSTVKLGMHGDQIRFEITDTGVGIPAQEQHHIFTRFFRASNASVMQPDAFGLGLFITQSFIKQHGGTIGFESEEGKGSTFWFEIPINPIA